MPSEQMLRIIRAQDLTFKARMQPPQDISGWTLAFRVRDSLGGTSVIYKTTAGGIAIDEAGQGTISISLARADTSSLTPSKDLAAGKGYVWEIRRTDSGYETVLARGQLILEQEVV